ncbi:MAG: ABC transporter permease [Cyanobacteria bacterium J06639_1]
MTLVRSRAETWMDVLLLGGLAGFLGILYLPLLVVGIFSFNSGRYQVLPLKEFSVQWYQNVWRDPAFGEAFGHSILVGVAVSLTATAVGFLGAYALVHSHFPGKTVLSALLVTPIAVPGILLGIALRVYFFRLGWQFSLFSVYLGHLVFSIPLALLLMRSRLRQIPKSLEEAAWDLGAKRWQGMWRVVLPLAFPAVIASLLLTFTFSFDEFIVAYFLTQFEQTLPIKIWANLITGFDPTVNAIGSLIVLSSLTLGAIAQVSLSKFSTRGVSS